jgi:hypothetical protein
VFSFALEVVVVRLVDFELTPQQYVFGFVFAVGIWLARAIALATSCGNGDHICNRVMRWY